MSHKEATGLLATFVSDGLEEPREAAVRAHLEECEECRDWIATYHLFEGVLGQEPRPEQSHPPSELLALCVVRPEEVFEVDRTELQDHLACCERCRGEVEILQEAIRQARPARAEPRFRAPVPVQTATWSRWGRLAAGVGLLAVGLAAGYFGLMARPESSPGPQAAALQESGESAELVAPDQLVDVEIEDTRLIEADQSLVVSNVKVKPGARVTFRVGEVAAFGDGFQISDGGSIVVESRRVRARAASPEAPLN